MKKAVADAKDSLTILKASQDQLNKHFASTEKYNAALIKSKETGIEIDKQDLAILEKQAEAAERLADVTLQKTTAKSTLGIAQSQRTGARTLGRAEQEFAIMETNEQLHTAEEIRKKREEILLIEYNNAMDILAKRAAQSEVEYKARIATLDREKMLQEARNAQMILEQSHRKDLVFNENRITENRHFLEKKALTDRQDFLAKQEALIEAEANLARSAVTAREIATLAEYDILKERADQIAKQASVFAEGGRTLAEVFDKFTQGVNAMQGTGIKRADIKSSTGVLDRITNDANDLKDEMEKVQTQIKNNATAERKIITDNETVKEGIRGKEVAFINRILIPKMNDRHAIEINIAKEEAELAEKMLAQKLKDGQAEVTNLQTLIDTEGVLQAARREGFAAEADAIQRNYDLKKALIERERESMLNFLNDLSGKLQGRFKEGIDSLFKAMNEGTLTMENFKEGFKDWLFNILGDIQQSLIDEFVTKPIQELIKSGMGSIKDLFRPEGAVKPADNVKDLIDTQRLDNMNLQQRAEAFAAAHVQQVHVINASEICACMSGKQEGRFDDPLNEPSDSPPPSLRNANEDLPGGLREDTAEAKGLFDLAGKDIVALGVTAVATFGSVYAATGDFKKSMIATFLAMFLQIAAQKAAAAIGSLLSSGGSVRKLAAGGVIHRDRVPALLEPGEFVIRKPMAKAIGGPALQQMNAHGTMPAGNVEVNMINKGTPQSAQVEQKPQIDGKGIVIEIVLNDLKNNGPIKQAMRGGGSR
jgi:hypothetical protein